MGIDGMDLNTLLCTIHYHCSRCLELFVYGLDSLEFGNTKRDAYKVMVLQEERDTSLLSLVGSFTKSAPQLVLEIYILVQRNSTLSRSASKWIIISYNCDHAHAEWGRGP